MRWLRSLDIPAEWLWLQHVMIIAAAILIAVLVHSVAMRVAGHAARRTASQSDDLVIAHIRQPLRWVAIAIAVSFAMRLVPMSGEGRDIWRQVLGFGVPALLGWLAVSALRALQGVVYLRADISVEDNLRARRKRTRAQILGRIGIFLIVFLTVCLMLLSVPGIRTIGVTLMASAGIAGLVVGAAAQPALKNLIAGVQMAFTEPIRLDDVVIIDNEWGRIEQIHLTFVVVRIWDERRLVVPVAKFLENSFQNWTRETSQLLGSVFWYLDPAADIPRLRTKMGELVEASTRWDRRFFNMQVTDTKPDSIEVRGLMTARDASTAFDLRCEIREGLLEYIRREMPEALPRRRLEHHSNIPPLQGEGDHAQHGGGGVPQRAPLAEAPLRQR